MGLVPLMGAVTGFKPSPPRRCRGDCNAGLIPVAERQRSVPSGNEPC